MTDSPQVARTREIEELSNLYVVHPISRALVSVLARWGVHPNLVSVTGMILGAVAAWAYFNYQQWEFAVLGFAMMFGWHVMDGADGQLARLTGKTSEIGKVLDGLCDHMSFTLVYAAIATAITIEQTALIWIPAALAGMSHIAQSSAYEFQRQSYDYWVHGKSSARVVTSAEVREDMLQKSGAARAFARMNLTYVTVQERFSAHDAALFSKLKELQSTNAETFAHVRDLYRSINMPAVRRWSMLSSNYRTLIIFLTAVSGVPAVYFWFEIVVLNIALVLLVRMQRRRYEMLKSRLRSIAPVSEQDAVDV